MKRRKRKKGKCEGKGKKINDKKIKIKGGIEVKRVKSVQNGKK
jgi:hypothetical protein